MARKVIWSKEAEKDFNNIIAYLAEDWPESVLESFINEVDAVVLLISISPYVGKKSEVEKEVRALLITKHNRLYYRIDKNRIELLNIFDTRQNPGKSKY